MADEGTSTQGDDAVEREILKLPLFAGLKPNAKKALVQGIRPEVYPAGGTFVQQGDFAGKFCIIIKGLAGVFRAEPGGGVVKRGTIGVGEWFGEMSALSNRPAVASVKAETMCVVYVLDPPLFKKLYAAGGAFKDLVDRRYRERALAEHLRVAPLFKGLADASLRKVKDDAELLVYEEGDVIVREGERADAVYLVRSGAVKCSRRTPRGEEKILYYYMDSSSFGEASLLDRDPSGREPAWPGTFVALRRTDLVKLPRALFESVFADDPTTLAALKGAAAEIIREEAGRRGTRDEATAASRRLADEIDVMVRSQSVKGGEALVIDLKRCIRCNACVESCVAVHEDRIPRLSKTGNRISANVVLASACYHCDEPGCMKACDYGAIRRDNQGSVRIIEDNCVGCSMCLDGCPYGVIRLASPRLEGPVIRRTSVFESIPLLGRFFQQSAAPSPAPAAGEEPVKSAQGLKVMGKAVKCDLCAGLPFEACVYNCPCSAISRVSPGALFGPGSDATAGAE